MFLLALLCLCVFLLFLSIRYYVKPDRLYVGLMPIVIVGGLLYAASRKKRAVQNVSYELGIPGGLYFDLPTASLKGKLKIIFDNASPQSFTVGNVYLKITQQGTSIGNVSRPGGFTIKPASRTEVECEFRIGLVALGVNLFRLIQSGVLQGGLVDGFVNSAGFNLYIREELAAIQVPQIPAWVKSLNIAA